MNKTKNIISILLCMILALGLAGCSKDADTSEDAPQTAQTTTAAVSTAAVTTSNDAMDTEEETTDGAVNEDEKKTSSESKKSDDEKSSKDSNTSKSKDSKKSSDTKKDTKKKTGQTITIKKGNSEKVFYESELKKMGLTSCKYSYRNKDSSQRQFLSVSGVKLKTLLDKSGFSGSKIRVTSSDGYTQEYTLSDLYANKKAFKKTYGDSANDVPAIITIGESDSYRLCFGQKADDADDNGDFNAQFWAKKIKSITVL